MFLCDNSCIHFNLQKKDADARLSTSRFICQLAKHGWPACVVAGASLAAVEVSIRFLLYIHYLGRGEERLAELSHRGGPLFILGRGDATIYISALFIPQPCFGEASHCEPVIYFK